MFGTAFGGSNEPNPMPEGDIFVKIPCTLTEFYNGAFKTINYKR